MSETDWQPIETAPRKPDEPVMLADASHVWFGRWHEEKGKTLVAADEPYWEPFDLSCWYLEDGYKDWFEPTHWQPLPKPPNPTT